MPAAVRNFYYSRGSKCAVERFLGVVLFTMGSDVGSIAE